MTVPYVPLNKASASRDAFPKPRSPIGAWFQGTFKPFTEATAKIAKKANTVVSTSPGYQKPTRINPTPRQPSQIQTSPMGTTQKSLGVYVPLRKAETTTSTTMQPKQQQKPTGPVTTTTMGNVAPSTQPAGPKAPVGNPEVRRMANDYVQQAGIAKHLPTQDYAPLLPEEHRKAVADAYDKAPHNPNDPDTQRAYAAFKHETKQQYEHAIANGMRFTPKGTETEPYKTSEEMRNDVLQNKHLGFYQGGDMPKDHPMAEVDPEHGLSYNDMFRATHDLYGHAKEGFEFGSRGEFNAYLSHKQMYSPVAQRALRTETHGQNNWVNYGPHLRNANGDVPKKGEQGWIHPNERPFAPQKAHLAPAWTDGQFLAHQKKTKPTFPHYREYEETTEPRPKATPDQAYGFWRSWGQ